MKFTFLCNDPLNYKKLLSELANNCRRFISICKDVNHVTDMFCIYELGLIITEADEFEDNKSSIIFLDELLNELQNDLEEINISANNNLKKFFLIKELLIQIKPTEQKPIINEKEIIFSVLHSIRTNANFIPLWLALAKEAKFSDKIEGENIIKTISSITEKCWKALSELNIILDNLPIDRTENVYCHFPENESELIS